MTVENFDATAARDHVVLTDSDGSKVGAGSTNEEMSSPMDSLESRGELETRKTTI